MAPQASNKMVRLTKSQLATKLKFIENYKKANNAANGSTFDANSNVVSKNIATMNAELNKDINIQIKRQLAYNKIKERFGKRIADNYIYQLEKHETYCHDETTITVYCSSVSIYPFLQNGLQDFGGESKAPQHLSSFNGGFVNLIFALSSQFCGAVATVEYLMCFDHYAIKDYGSDYLNTHTSIIKQELQQVIYALNQPASARNFQSVFWNISIFDKYYFEALFGNFYFPDGTKPEWKSVNKLQKFFMRWFNEERTKALLTFPVITVSMLNDGNTIKDTEYYEFISEELSKGNSFFIYTSQSVDSLSSCCRLRNSITDQINDFSYSLGAGGVQTGSVNVITLNMNRFVQDFFHRAKPNHFDENYLSQLLEALRYQIGLINKYQLGYRDLFKDFQENNLFPAYSAGFINMDKQYSTVGINGLIEAAEFLGYTPGNNDDYKHFISSVLKAISNENNHCKKLYGVKFNTELVPAENLGVKFAKWDKIDGYEVPRDCYNSYLYPVENEDITVIDKFVLHGKETTEFLDGGSALHLNLEDIPSKETCQKLLDIAVKTGCPYFCINVKVTICNDCTYIDKHTNRACVKCGSKNIDYGTRVIGYLRRVTNFSSERQQEELKRHYHKIHA